MRRLAAAAAAIAAALIAPAASAATPDRTTVSDAAPRRPSLLPAGGDPFRVRGSGFRRRELVRVTVTRIGATTGRTRRVRASTRGRFVLAFAGVHTCRGIRAKAVGNRGSRASFVLNSVTC